MMGGRRAHASLRVLILSMYYSPDVTGTAPYSAALAEQLARRGDEVTVVAGFPHYPAWRIARGTPRRLLRRETIRGVTVIRAAHYVPASQSAVKRVLYEGTFGLTGLLATFAVRRPDAILGIVPTLSGGVLARLTGARLAVPYGLLFQNLIGPGAGQLGISGGASVARGTAAAEAWAARQARAIGVVTEAFTPYLVSLGVPNGIISHIPNWSRLAQPDMTVPETRAHFRWMDGTQVVLHAGNMGRMQGLEQVVEAARSARAQGLPVQFVLSGDGHQAAGIRAAACDLPNVTFLPMQPDRTHASMLAAADVLLLSERPMESDLSLPSKLTSYFSAGRPIVAAVGLGGSSAREIDRSGAGLVVPAANVTKLLAALDRLRTEPGLVSGLSAAGPIYAAGHTSAAACLVRAVGFVDAIAGRMPVQDSPLVEAA
jgi:Glycosyltransferase